MSSPCSFEHPQLVGAVIRPQVVDELKFAPQLVAHFLPQVGAILCETNK